ncbi:MAG: Uma2 family endonuclease [Leptolyngbyaceae cyanobacterium]
MVAQLTKVPSQPDKSLTVTWEHLPADYVLPDDPVENIQQPSLAAALTDALGEAGWIQPHMLLASNFGLVATVAGKTVVKAPDWLYVPRAHPISEGVVRRSYTPHVEGTPVTVVMEFLSETETGEYSIRPVFPYGKMFFYQSILQVPTYILFDPTSVTLQVFHLQEAVYQVAEANEQGRFWLPEMQLFLGIWEGTRLGTTAHWLRWWDMDDNLLLWSSEKADQERQRAEQERQRAEQLATKLRKLGIDPDAEN